MEKLLFGMGAALAMAIILFLGALLGATFGAFAGWVVSLVWNDEVMRALTAFGVDVEHVTLSNIGAALGFIGAFFKSPSVSSSD